MQSFIDWAQIVITITSCIVFALWFLLGIPPMEGFITVSAIVATVSLFSLGGGS